MVQTAKPVNRFLVLSLAALCTIFRRRFFQQSL